MCSPYYHKRFRKDYKKLKSRKLDINLLHEAIKILLDTGTLADKKYDTHPLIGNYAGYMEAHLDYDWLIIWRIYDNDKIELYRTGSHHELFK